MSYVDGFVIPLPEKNLEAYREMAELSGKLWMEHGALAFKECIGDDLTSEHTNGSFLKAAGAQEKEIVIFSFIVYRSREHRDEVNAKVMADPRLKCNEDAMPFDCKRMAYGGFKVIVDL